MRKLNFRFLNLDRFKFVLFTLFVYSCSGLVNDNNVWKLPNDFEQKYGKIEKLNIDIGNGVQIPEFYINNFRGDEGTIFVITPMYDPSYKEGMDPNALNEKDKAVFDLYSNPEVYKRIGPGKAPDLNVITKNRVLRTERWKNPNKVVPSFRIEIENKDKKRIAAGMIICGLDVTNIGQKHCMDLSYIVGEDYWSRGYASAASLITMNYLNDLYESGKLDYSLISATARIDNLASNKVLEKCGFNLKGKTEKFNFSRNEYEYEFSLY